MVLNMKLGYLGSLSGCLLKALLQKGQYIAFWADFHFL